MKQTRKKLISLLLGLLCVFSLAACGSQKESTRNADVQSQAEQNAVGLVQTIVELSDSDIENYMISGDEFTENAMAAWNGAREELGELVEIQSEDLTAEYDESGKLIRYLFLQNLRMQTPILCLNLTEPALLPL